ncbi:hypothetical protein E2C01_004076 [Portunus trituberculatus]|uniref:Uncharacterized protein n=1 Tax=Portunus trituberculatus TaxID=210409 RepID=A0A5B7CNX9_PORTR|nr:hypothetical protein [Portunus trituberculatus]
MWAFNGNLCAKGDTFLWYLLSQSPPASKSLPRVRKPNLHSDRGQDSNPCAWRPLGPQTQGLSARPPLRRARPAPRDWLPTPHHTPLHYAPPHPTALILSPPRPARPAPSRPAKRKQYSRILPAREHEEEEEEEEEEEGVEGHMYD